MTTPPQTTVLKTLLNNFKGFIALRFKSKKMERILEVVRKFKVFN